MYSSEKAHRVMTCVRASNDETSPIQIWNCDQEDPQKVYYIAASDIAWVYACAWTMYEDYHPSISSTVVVP